MKSFITTINEMSINPVSKDEHRVSVNSTDHHHKVIDHLSKIGYKVHGEVHQGSSLTTKLKHDNGHVITVASMR
jgi:hypothetical protein